MFFGFFFVTYLTTLPNLRFYHEGKGKYSDENFNNVR